MFKLRPKYSLLADGIIVMLLGVFMAALTIFMHRSNVKRLLAGQEVKTDITWHGERAAHFISNSMSQGAVLVDGDGIVRVKCADAATA